LNIELIRQNLNACEEEMASGNPQAACTLAFQTARVLLTQAGTGFRQAGVEPQPLLIASVKAANALSSLFASLEPQLDTPAVTEKQRQRILALKELFAQKQAECADLEAAGKELLDAEKALRQEEARLEAIRGKIQELTLLKEKRLGELKMEIAAWQEKAKALEEACQAAQDELKRVQALLDEDSELIRNLPSSVGAADVDELIRYAKGVQENRREDAEQSEQVLAQILEALEQLYAVS